MSRVVRRVLSLGVALLVTVGLGVTPAAAADPGLIGSLDSVSVQADGTIRVSGWALAREGGPVAVHVYDTGPSRTVGTVIGTARLPRPDVEAVFGPGRGFDRSVPIAEQGAHSVCVYAVINRGPATFASLLGCRSVSTGFAPVGAIDVIPTRSVEGEQIRVSGWAYDPDQPQTPLEIHAYVKVAALTTGTRVIAPPVIRPDVAAVFPGVGPRSGFDFSLSLSQYLVDGPRSGSAWYQGVNTVCLFAIGVGNGGNSLIGCREVQVAPKVNAALDPVTFPALGTMKVQGWSYLVNSPGETTQNRAIITDVDNPQWSGNAPEFAADRPRPDVDRAFPGVGSNHGYEFSVLAVPGRYKVCVQTRSHTAPPVFSDQFARSECREAVAPNALGVVDSIVIGEAGPDTVTIRGWVVDPLEPSASPDIRAAVSSGLEPDWVMSTLQAQQTTIPRPDVNAALGVAGVHGYEVVIAVPTGFFAGGGRTCVTAAVFSVVPDSCLAAFASADVPVG